VAELETVDIPAVEILASGGPVKAIGSPPGGDFYTREDLERIVAAHHELGDEIRAPIKIGHSDRQKLAENSGLTAGEMPALGWLDNSTFRVEDDEEAGVAKLVADAKAVPAKLAELMRSGAYRTRSSEIRQYASQATQKSYDWVVNGLALLGANVPAIQTLDDVYRLYERADLEKPDADTYVIRRHAAGDVVWDVEDGLEDLRGDLNDALNPAGYNLPGVPQLWVRDIARSSLVALVSSGYGDDDDAWVVPFTLGGDGEPTPAPRDQWKAAEQTWVAAANDLERKNRRAAESRPMELTFTDEQAAAVREQLGIEADDLTPEALVDAATDRANELAEAKKTAEERKNEADTETAERLRKLEADAAEGKKAAERLFEMERDTLLDEAIRVGKIDPAERESWQKRYERDAEMTREIVEDLKADETLTRELGRDDDGSEQTEEQRRNENSELNEIFPGADLRVEATS
jgi:hypothetical protein